MPGDRKRTYVKVGIEWECDHDAVYAEPRVARLPSGDSGRIANESRDRGIRSLEQQANGAGPFRESDAPAGSSEPR